MDEGVDGRGWTRRGVEAQQKPLFFFLFVMLISFIAFDVKWLVNPTEIHCLLPFTSPR